MLFVFDQGQLVVNALRQIFLIMGHHNDGFVLSLGKGVDDVSDQLSVTIVQTVQRFIQHQQLGVFDKGSCQ